MAFINARLPRVDSSKRVQQPCVDEHPRRHQERIAWQKEAHQKPGFGEDDRHKYRISAPGQQAIELVEPPEKFAQDV